MTMASTRRWPPGSPSRRPARGAGGRARRGPRDRAAMTAEVARGARDDHGVDETVAAGLVEQALSRVREESVAWPTPTDHDRLESVFAALRAVDVLVLQHVDDHWTA